MIQNTEKYTKINENLVNRLVRMAQKAPNREKRAEAIGELWTLCQDYIMKVAVKKSYHLDPDFSMHGMNPMHRREELSTEIFLNFRDCVLSFDPTLERPFLAWVAQNIRWRLLDDKRANAKHSKREVVYNCAPEGCSGSIYDDDRDDPGTCEEWEDGENKRLVAWCRKIIEAQGPKLLHAFDAMAEDCNANDRYCDARVARELGCSRANVGNLKKKIRGLLETNGMLQFKNE